MSTRCVKAVRAVRSVSVVTSPDMCHGEGLAGNDVMCHGEGWLVMTVLTFHLKIHEH